MLSIYWIFKKDHHNNAISTADEGIFLISMLLEELTERWSKNIVTSMIFWTKLNNFIVIFSQKDSDLLISHYFQAIKSDCAMIKNNHCALNQ